MADFRIVVRAGIDLNSESIRLIEVGLVCGAQRRDVVLDADNAVAVAEFSSDDARHPVQYQYRAHAYSGPFTQGPQSSFEAPPRTTDAGIIVINPRELYRFTEVRAVSMIDPERFMAAFVDVKVEGDGWSGTETMQLSHSAREGGVRILTANTSSAAIQHRLRYVTSAGAIIEGAWQPTEPGLIIVTNPATAAAPADV